MVKQFLFYFVSSLVFIKNYLNIIFVISRELNLIHKLTKVVLRNLTYNPLSNTDFLV